MSSLAEAKQAAQRGELDRAESILSQALASEPGNGEAKLVLGIVKYQKGDPVGSLAMFRSVLDTDPDNFVALNWAGMLAHTIGDPQAGADYCVRAMGIAPGQIEPLFNLGVCLAKMARFGEAREYLERAVRSQPNRPIYLRALGEVLVQTGSLTEAVSVFHRATAIEPTEQNFISLMECELLSGQPDRAQQTAERAGPLWQNSARVNVLLGQAKFEQEDDRGAQENFERAVELDPHQFDAYVGLGNVHQLRGAFAEAEPLFRKALEIEPNLQAAYFGIVKGRTITEQDRSLVERMEELATDRRLPEAHRPQLCYALAKAFDNLNEPAKAIEFYDKANRLQRHLKLSDGAFKADRVRREVDARIRLYTPELYDRLRPKAETSNRPIFVLGMMRSGTTLVEQILSCHPAVGGAGEMAFWASNEDRLTNLDRGRADPQAIQKAARDYLALLQAKVPDKPHVTDKNPANVMAAGLIHAALPQAKIIHTMRDPVDTALSIWITPVNQPPDFCCDRDNIVSMYREYLRIAEHWRKVLPPDLYLEVSYESLVQNQEAETRRILEFLGLEWHEGCLFPERNLRNVRTPSLWQVRQPLYRSSISRWKRYEPWIPEFLGLRC
jgi:tetratricopeptide (TPR) repeat protein